jgi:hypothetical protein
LLCYLARIVLLLALKYPVNCENILCILYLNNEISDSKVIKFWRYGCQ